MGIQEEDEGIEYVVTFTVLEKLEFFKKHRMAMHVLAKSEDAAVQEISTHYAQSGEHFTITSVEALPEMTEQMQAEVDAGNVEPVGSETLPKTKLN